MKFFINTLLLFYLFLFPNCEKHEGVPSYNGLTFTSFQESGLSSSIKLGENFVNYNEVMGYDSTKYIFLLNDRAKERILKNSTSSFVVTVDGLQIYIAVFIPGYSSISCFECVRIEPFSHNNKYLVELGYPGDTSLFTGVDLRNDERIIACLKRDNKLIEIDD